MWARAEIQEGVLETAKMTRQGKWSPSSRVSLAVNLLPQTVFVFLFAYGITVVATFAAYSFKENCFVFFFIYIKHYACMFLYL